MQEEKITNFQYNKFINTGRVARYVLNKISSKIKKNITLSQREMAIFMDKTGEIEQILSKKTK